MPSGQGLGRRPSSDPRNLGFPMRAALPLRARLGAASTLILPKLKTWTFMGHPLDQSSTGTCTAHAAAHFIHCAPFAHRAFLDPFQLYREIVLLDEWTDNDREATGTISQMQSGSSGTGAAKALHKRGLIEGGYHWGQKVEDVVLWLQSRGPVMIGVNWYDSFFSPYKGLLRITPGNSRPVGGHEICANFIDTKRGLIGGPNSWGPGWNADGERYGVRPGHWRMPLELLQRLLEREEGDAVSALEAR